MTARPSPPGSEPYLYQPTVEKPEGFAIWPFSLTPTSSTLASTFNEGMARRAGVRGVVVAPDAGVRNGKTLGSSATIAGANARYPVLLGIVGATRESISTPPTTTTARPTASAPMRTRALHVESSLNHATKSREPLEINTPDLAEDSNKCFSDMRVEEVAGRKKHYYCKRKRSLVYLLKTGVWEVLDVSFSNHGLCVVGRCA